jgi:hypothetical protein
MHRFYKASEAIKRLGIPRSTFFVLVQTGQIPKVYLPLRKQGLYPKEEIDQLAAEQARILEELEPEPPRLQFMIPTQRDFEQIVEIDTLLFPQETWMTPEKLQERLPHNPEVTHVLKDIQTETVMSYISMSPLRGDILEELITLRIDETSLKPEHFTPYTPDTPLDCYIVSIGARPGSGIMQQIYAGKLILAMENYLLELLEKGVTIRHIYAIATTKAGNRLAQGLHFMPFSVTGSWRSGYEDFRQPYVLDLENKKSVSKLVKQYQTHQRNRKRRLKRYLKDT